MRTFSITIFFELVITIIILYFLLTTNYYNTLYLRGYVKEDLLASLISINYLDLNNTIQLNQTLYEIVTNIFPYYYVEINNITVFNNMPLSNATQGIEEFYIINGSIDYVNIYWK
ncbi:hypothetical protein YN1_3090 [Nanoarchaeota archaeon]